MFMGRWQTVLIHAFLTFMRARQVSPLYSLHKEDTDTTQHFLNCRPSETPTLAGSIASEVSINDGDGQVPETHARTHIQTRNGVRLSHIRTRTQSYLFLAHTWSNIDPKLSRRETKHLAELLQWQTKAPRSVQQLAPKWQAGVSRKLFLYRIRGRRSYSQT